MSFLLAWVQMTYFCSSDIRPHIIYTTVDTGLLYIDFKTSSNYMQSNEGPIQKPPGSVQDEDSIRRTSLDDIHELYCSLLCLQLSLR